MSYAEQELVPLGFRVVSDELRQVVLSFHHLKLQFDCSCPVYPTIRAAGCPLHCEKSAGDDSWPVDDAKKIPAAFA